MQQPPAPARAPPSDDEIREQALRAIRSSTHGIQPSSGSPRRRTRTPAFSHTSAAAERGNAFWPRDAQITRLTKAGPTHIEDIKEEDDPVAAAQGARRNYRLARGLAPDPDFPSARVFYCWIDKPLRQYTTLPKTGDIVDIYAVSSATADAQGRIVVFTVPQVVVKAVYNKNWIVAELHLQIA
jgi:hypothetical protein